MNVYSPNIPMCDVCGVPVNPENMATHVAGRAHAWKFLLSGGSTVCSSETTDSPQVATSVFRIERSFSSVFNSVPRLTTEKGVRT
ncbi:unnamed protein product [Dibothriocephalus latus]|uniref:U1-type domain-containing protein n=1 Tax=Dibothriocephalus latus TaxID=60516 RepID=A0A3P7LNP9_DIBLA|nr:unnamed protein product [Dibothriocephalus latus]